MGPRPVGSVSVPVSSGSCGGSAACRIEPWEDYQYKVDTIIGRYFGHLPHYKEDLRQEGLIALLEGCRTYDPGLGVPLGAWLWVKIFNELRKAAAHYDRKALYDPVARPLAVDPEGTVEHRLAELPWHRLGKREYWVIYLNYMEGLELPDVASALQLTTHQAKWARQRALQKLRGE